MWEFTVGVLLWILSLAYPSYDFAYFIVCTYILVLILKRWGLAYSHAIIGNGTLANLSLCKNNGGMLFNGDLRFCLPVCELTWGWM